MSAPESSFKLLLNTYANINVQRYFDPIYYIIFLLEFLSLAKKEGKLKVYEDRFKKEIDFNENFDKSLIERKHIDHCLNVLNSVKNGIYDYNKNIKHQFNIEKYDAFDETNQEEFPAKQC